MSDATLDSLNHISEVIPLSEADKPLIDDLVAVLRKHNALSRFGLTLLHRHFALADGEVLLETTDVPAREQFIRPIAKEKLDGLDYIETAWRLDTGEPIMPCVCLVRGGEHSGTHRHIN